MNLIVNADDFGLSRAVNLGIIDAFRHGIVSSTTMLAAMPGFDDAVALAKQNPGLKIGVHLRLTMGRPVGSDYQTLTDASGDFLKQTAFFAAASGIDPAEVEAEYTAQIEQIRNAGLNITHIDGHHHTHALPAFWGLTKRLCKKYGLAIRCVGEAHTDSFKKDGFRTTDQFSADFYGDNITEEALIQMISGYTSDSLEIMCHPAYIDKTLYELSSYNLKRIYELDILTRESVRRMITEKNRILCGYDAL